VLVNDARVPRLIRAVLLVAQYRNTDIHNPKTPNNDNTNNTDTAFFADPVTQ